MLYREIEQSILDIISEANTIDDAIKLYFSKIVKTENHKVIKELLNYDYNKDYENITNNILFILNNDKPSFKIKAFWFGLFETNVDGNTTFQTYLSATNKFNNNSNDWAVNPKYFPENRYINSEILSKINSDILYYNDNLEIEYFPLWYLSLVIGIFIKQNYNIFLNYSDKSYICIGFDEGDYNNIGFFHNNGFTINKINIPKPAKLKKTKTTYKYYSLKNELRGAWFLNGVERLDGETTVNGFSRISRFISPKCKFQTTYSGKYDGVPVDYSEQISSGPIVSERFMKAVLKHCDEDSVQFIPITITNYNSSNYYLMNTLKEIQCLDSINTLWYAKNYADKIVLEENKIKSCPIFRIADKNIINNVIIINSSLKEELELQNFTGLSIKGINLS